MKYSAMAFVLMGFIASASADAETSNERTPVATVTVTAAQNPGTIDPAKLNQACAGTLGLDRSEAPYESCVRSLRQTLTSLDFQPAPANR